MPDPASPSRGPRPWRAIASVAAFLVMAVLSWSAWRLASDARRTAEAQPIPAAPVIRENLLVAAPIPAPAPALELPTAAGGRFTLAEARGRVVIVNFWATWCGPCTQELPTLVQLERGLEQRHPGKFRVVTISADEDPGAVARFFAAPAYGGLPPGLVVALEPGSGPVGRAFRCQGRGACRPEDVRYPETFVVDQHGRIVAMVVGFIDWSTPGSMRFLEALLEG